METMFSEQSLLAIRQRQDGCLKGPRDILRQREQHRGPQLLEVVASGPLQFRDKRVAWTPTKASQTGLITSKHLGEYRRGVFSCSVPIRFAEGRGVIARFVAATNLGKCTD